MNRYAVNGYGLSLSKQHESNVQDIRHERKSEGEHLDRLKKTLQTKLRPEVKEADEIRAASGR
jgi:hypothetical protein